jgi:hypothetical protein
MAGFEAKFHESWQGVAVDVRAEGDSGNVNISLPLWKRGIKGDLKMECPFFLYKISPGSSFPKRGIKEVYSNGINISSFKNYCSAALLRYCSIKPVMLYSFGKTKLLPDIYYEEE